MNVDKVESGAVRLIRVAGTPHRGQGDWCGTNAMDNPPSGEYVAVKTADFASLVAAARDGEKWRKERDEARALLKDARYVLWQAGLYKGYDVAGPLSTPVAQGLVARIDRALGADAGR